MARDSYSSKLSLNYSGYQEIGRGDFRRDTHNDVRHLAEWVVRSVRRDLMLTLGEVDGDDFIWDVVLLCDECYATRASGRGKCVQFE
jgi:hypothetical protein